MSANNVPEYILGYIRDRSTIATLGGIWHDQKLEWSSGNLIYYGVHEMHNMPDSDENFEIWKYTWTSGDLTRMEGPLRGSWTGRATLGWA
jgi:hypothetical protein